MVFQLSYVNLKRVSIATFWVAIDTTLKQALLNMFDMFINPLDQLLYVLVD